MLPVDLNSALLRTQHTQRLRDLVDGWNFRGVILHMLVTIFHALLMNIVRLYACYVRFIQFQYLANYTQIGMIC